MPLSYNKLFLCINLKHNVLTPVFSFLKIKNASIPSDGAPERRRWRCFGLFFNPWRVANNQEILGCHDPVVRNAFFADYFLCFLLGPGLQSFSGYRLYPSLLEVDHEVKNFALVLPVYSDDVHAEQFRKSRCHPLFLRKKYFL